MAEEKITRKLTTILAADVEGYTRLMRADEEATLKILDEYRDVIDGLIARHEGRVFSTGGDSVLAEFGSAVEAVRCAISFQEEISSRNAELADDQKLIFRIGINVGDVMVRDGDLFGDGVNVAARLEGLAEPGGVCISGSVFEQIKHKLSLGFEDMGQQEVKNIAEPVSAYRLVPGRDSISAGATVAAGPSAARRWWMPAIAVAVVVIIAVGGLTVWRPWEPKLEPVSVENTTFPMGDKPSIAVLPFQNMSNDSNQDYFADGLAEDLITDLSKISNLLVIARNSSFQYRGRSVDVVQVGRELRVQYILEGSVRRAEDRVRINAQLIDATTGSHVWAERYDGTLADVFSVQDQVTGRIIDALKLQLTPSERRAVDAHGTDEPAAYDAYLRGLRLLSERRRIDVDANRAAQAEFEEAIRIDPDYASAIAGLAWSKWLYIETINEFESFDKAFALAERSIALNDNALAHRTLAKRHLSLLGYWVLTTKKMDLAVAELEMARQLQPSDPDVLADLATALSFAGQPQRALTLIQKAMELNPSHPIWYFAVSGIALLLTENPERAVGDLQTWLEVNPNWHVPYIFLAAALANSGDEAAARAALARFNQLLFAGTTLYFIRNKWPMARKQAEVFERGLRLAGVKETPG